MTDRQNGQNGQNAGYSFGRRHYDGHQSEPQTEEGISLKELLLILIRGKKTIAVITAVVLVITALGTAIVPNVHIGSKGQVQTVVKVYFSGIEKGMTPDGKQYDVNEIKLPSILQEAADQVSLSGDPAISDLAANISFQSLLPDEAAETLQNIKDLKTEELKLERLESLEINPDTYIVTLNVANRLGITREEGRELLDSILREYKEYLMHKYSGYQFLPDLFAEDFSLDNYDYIQAADILDSQLTGMEEYVRTFNDSNFTSPGTGYSAADLLNTLQAVRNVELEQIYTKIAAFNVTKDAGKSVAIYEYIAEEKEKQAAQKSEEAAALKDAIVNFKANEQTVVLGNGAGEPLTIKTESEQYDRFVSRYIEAGAAAQSAAADAAYYRNEAARFLAMEGNPQAISGPDSQAANDVDDLIGRMKDKIIYWTEVINRASEDYYTAASFQQYAEQLIPTQSYDVGQGANLPLNLAIGLVLGLVLGILVVLFRAYMKEDISVKMTSQLDKGRQQEQEVTL